MGENVFLRKDGRWEARYCKGRNEKGRILYACVYGKTREEAEQKRSEILKNMDVSLQIHPRARKDTLSEAEAAKLKTRQKLEKPLDENTALRLESVMLECCGGVKLALAFALYMGLSFSEICALRFSDIDKDNGIVFVNKKMYDRRNENSVFVTITERCVPIPSIMLDFLANNADANHYILTDTLAAIDTVRKGVNLCSRELEKHGFADNINLDNISATFIRRALEAGLNVESVSLITGIEKVSILKKYSMYSKPEISMIEHIVKKNPQNKKVEDIQVKAESNEIAPISEMLPLKQMNLLILGAGSQGPVVKEIAEAIGIFGEIAYLDDDPNNMLAIDTCRNYKKYLDKYPIAIPSFGDCQLRAMWCDLLEQAGFILPKLVHPSATMLGNVEIQSGTVIEAKVILSSGTKIGKNCIISAGSVIDKESIIGANTHIDCACTIPKGSVVAPYTRLSAGMIYQAHGTA